MMADHEDDSRWDYDCPQFVDFTMPMPFNDGADRMFEHTVIGEGPSTAALQVQAVQMAASLNHQEIKSEMTNQAVPLSISSSTKALGEKAASQNTDGRTAAQSTDISEEAPEIKPSNVITSLERNVITSLEPLKNPGKHSSSEPSEGSPRKKPRKSAETATKEIFKNSEPKPALKRSASVRMQKSTSVSNLPPNSSSSMTSSTSDLRSKKHARGLSSGRERSNSVGVKSTPEVKKEKEDTSRTRKMSKLDLLAGGPSFLRQQGANASSTSSKIKSTEEMELERIEQLKKELQHKRRLAEESYKKAMAKTAFVAKPHAQVTTLPQEFHFQTDARIKEDKKAEEKLAGEVDFVKMLRSRTVMSPNHASSGPKTCTVPQPFHLTEKSKSSSKLQLAPNKFESMAEKVSAFHRRTPERFRARPRSVEKSKYERARSHSPPGLTIAHTPNLQSRNRHRPITALSQKEIEEKELEEIKKNQFKANPVNTKIFLNPKTGVRKVTSKPSTQPEEFQLSANNRRDRSQKEEEEERYEFHAKPLNKKILEGPVGVKPAKAALPTVPMSPAFALKHRVRLPMELPENKADPSTGVMKAKPVPHTGIPFQPKLPHQHTVPEPFLVETRSKAMLAQKEEKIRQILEEERQAREFHAQPLPSLDPGELPPKAPKEPTKLEPFQLETDLRGSKYLQEFADKQIAAEEEELRKAVEFHAQPNRTKDKRPFFPAPSTKPLTEVSDFELNCDRRAVQRDEFEMRKKEREAELEGLRRQREQRQKEEEEVAIAKLRAEMVHKPNPVRKYVPVIVKPSDKPLTDAESPRFSDRLRSKVRL